MRKTITTRYDVAEHLRTPEEMAAYLEACLEEAEGDAAFIAKALGDIARAKGMTQVARDAGLSRESLYKALSGEHSPGFDTILKVVGALGIQLHAAAAQNTLIQPEGGKGSDPLFDSHAFKEAGIIDGIIGVRVRLFPPILALLREGGGKEDISFSIQYKLMYCALALQ